MKKVALLALLLVSPWFLPPAAAKDKPVNLLPNGGFENKLDGWMFINNSRRATTEVQKKTRKEGKHALKITKSGGMPLDLLRTEVKDIVPGTRVKISMQVKGEKVGNAFVKFWAYDQAGNSLIQDVDITQLRGDFGWKEIEKTYDLPKEAANAHLQIVMIMGGELYVDDVRVEGASARPPLDEKTRKWLDKNAVKIASLEMSAPTDDLVPIGKALKGVRIVQLGEQSHGDGTCFRVKTRLAKYLHKELGFDVVVWEAGLLDCEQTNALLAAGKIREALFASVPGVWRVAEVHALFAYMAETHKTDRPLLLAGFDHQATGGGVLKLGEQIAALLGDQLDAGRLALLGQDVEQAIRNHWDGKKDSETIKIRARMVNLLEEVMPKLEQVASSDPPHKRAREASLLLRAAGNLHVLLQRAIKGGSDNEYVNERDARMAGNLKWLIDTYYAGKRVITWGATFHLMHGSKGIRDGKQQPYKKMVPMGEAIHKAYGKKCYTIGFAAHHGNKGNLLWGPFPIPEAPQGSIEDQLMRYGEPLLFVDMRKRGPFHDKLQLGILGYSRSMVAKWPSVIDGLVFTAENAVATAMQTK
ncbi:MAG: hypothetical protein GY946_17830 [bacterium]|nr:hypothetical protein [bacterium]